MLDDMTEGQSLLTVANIVMLLHLHEVPSKKPKNFSALVFYTPIWERCAPFHPFQHDEIESMSDHRKPSHEVTCFLGMNVASLMHKRNTS